ncbi:cAMP-dependent protein kinase catalytic subunit, putative [Pediculus humanus corporis]|uniref:cAMP-dependent protein kinase catalytic subunit, putative n=1 Tax=Pediculus humanus subsp. corporis TaxID=121224 RepID=E0VDF3_PEDHC|nr:cAMP-dependent protein kinase catalytic subunit, putative [Pediculus humanus corporis]EEB11409.1 cAMP-dependent protein kinase catalytic subunit, putative [Pediculus humanus corporis]
MKFQIGFHLRKGRTEWACKVMKKDHLNKKEAQMKISTLLELNHPNIINIKQVFETENEVQLVMELVHGEELFEKIVGKGFYSEKDAAQCVGDILKALQYLHGHGIIHKDLKPENLLYISETDDSELKLADYEMNVLLSDRQQEINRNCGSFGLSAPELILNKEYDSSVDLWYVGVVTYIMLCGFEPFLDEKSQVPTTGKIINGDYTFPSPWWDEISDSAKELITRLLSTDPKLRPTTTEALNHPWILGISVGHLHMNDTILKLREFNARKRFRVATKAVLATRRALSFLPNKNNGDNDKTVLKSLQKSPLDGTVIDLKKNTNGDGNNESCKLSPIDVSDKDNIDIIKNLTIDGSVLDNEKKFDNDSEQYQYKGNCDNNSR